MAAAAPQPSAATPPPSRSFKFHGRTFLAFVLKPEMPIGRWIDEADSWLSRSPGFFSAKPVVVDVSRLLLTKGKLAKLIADLGSRGIRVMGLLGADPAWVDADLPPVLTPGRATDPKTSRETHEAVAPVKLAPSSLVIDTHVRSGQTLFHDGDLTIIGSVSSGAESSPRDRSTSMARCAVGSWPAPTATSRRTFFAAVLPPSLWRSTAITAWPRTFPRA